MTLAAPPEKMTNAEDLALKFIEALGATVAHSVTLNRLEVLTIAREAAGRLSAPAPAAPRVGDDDLHPIGSPVWNLCGMIPPNGKFHVCRDSDTVAHYIIAMDLSHEQASRLVDCHNAALSAPPAASADERETMAEEIFSGVHPRWMWKTWTDEGDPETYGRKQFRAMADAALGYRKRAAQGVGTDIEAGAARVHLRYLSAAKRLGWTIRPGLDVPYEQLSEAAKEIDRETYRAAIAGGDDE